jgi:peptidoglycan/LPS O-acetylase OafA/YrhL
MPSRRDIPSLTGLRGVAACSVLFGHAVNIAFFYEPRALPFSEPFGHFGMALFFVLSGFVIHYNYADLFQKEPLGFALRRFFIARFARLYPLYAVAILCSLAMIPFPFPWWVVLSYLTMTQSWLNVEMAIFAPAWSVSTEWFFYVAFVPSTAVIFWLRRPIAVFVVLSLTTIGTLAVAFTLWRAACVSFAGEWFWHGDTSSADPWDWLAYFAPYVRVLDFIAGMLMAQAYRMSAPIRLSPILLPAGLLWCAAAAASFWLKLPTLGTLEGNCLYAPGIALVMLSCTQKNWLSRAMSSPPMLFLGAISYSIYIWSFFVFPMLHQMFSGPIPITLHYVFSGVKVIAIMGVTIIVAYGSYHLIEVPSRRFIRSYGRGR